MLTTTPSWCRRPRHNGRWADAVNTGRASTDPSSWRIDAMRERGRTDGGPTIRSHRGCDGGRGTPYPSRTQCVPSLRRSTRRCSRQRTFTGPRSVRIPPRDHHDAFGLLSICSQSSRCRRIVRHWDLQQDPSRSVIAGSEPRQPATWARCCVGTHLWCARLYVFGGVGVGAVMVAAATGAVAGESRTTLSMAPGVAARDEHGDDVRVRTGWCRRCRWRDHRGGRGWSGVVNRR